MKLSILIVILSVFWAAIFFALFNDKPLIPEVNEILEVSPNHVPDDENAYLAILGMQYETDIEPHVIGRQLVSRHQTFVHKKANEIESLQQNIDYPVRSLSFNVQDNSNFCFSNNNRNCREVCCWPEDLIEETWRENQYLLEYLNKLYEYKEYQHLGENIPTNIIDILGQVAALHAIYLMQEGDDERAFSSILKSAALWRKLLDNPTTSLESAFLRLNLHRSVLILSDLIQRNELVRRNYQFEELVSPLPLHSTMENIMRGELLNYSILRVNPHYMYDLGALDEYLIIEEKNKSYTEYLFKKFFLKPNLTLNRIYFKYNEISQHKDVVCELHDQTEEESILGRYYLYNMLGNMILDNQATYGQIRSQIRINAYMQLLRLIYELKLQELKPENLKELKSYDAITKSYTGESAQFNYDDYKVYIKKGSLSGCKIELNVHNWIDDL